MQKHEKKEYLIKIARDVVTKFIVDWQNEPYRWSREIDIQMEIASRIDIAYQMIGMNLIRANYKTVVSGYEKKQVWNRVCCEPATIYPDECCSDKKKDCRPDIVVWDELDDPDNPPDALTNKNFPMLWACEIKLNDKSKENLEWDKDKMECLLAKADAESACCLNFYREKTEEGEVDIQKESKVNDKRLLIYDIKLPKLI